MFLTTRLLWEPLYTWQPESSLPKNVLARMTLLGEAPLTSSPLAPRARGRSLANDTLASIRFPELPCSARPWLPLSWDTLPTSSTPVEFSSLMPTEAAVETSLPSMRIGPTPASDRIPLTPVCEVVLSRIVRFDELLANLTPVWFWRRMSNPSTTMKLRPTMLNP